MSRIDRSQLRVKAKALRDHADHQVQRLAEMTEMLLDELDVKIDKEADHGTLGKDQPAV